MTDLTRLRDEFAMAALQGIGTWMPIDLNRVGNPDLKTDEAMKARAEWAYRQADAMLDARDAESSTPPETET